MSRWRWAATVLGLLLTAGTTHAQSGPYRTIWDEPAVSDFLFAPYGGLPTASNSPGMHQALGFHLVWSAGARVGTAARYETRWDADRERTDVVTLDLVSRLVGAGQGNISATLGWAYWRRSYAMAGLRAMWPFFEPVDGPSQIQAWFEVRYGAPTGELTGKGILWTELMLAFAFPVAL